MTEAGGSTRRYEVASPPQDLGVDGFGFRDQEHPDVAAGSSRRSRRDLTTDRDEGAGGADLRPWRCGGGRRTLGTKNSRVREVTMTAVLSSAPPTTRIAARGCRCRQGVRPGRHRGPRPRRGHHRLRGRTSHRDHGPVGLRQVDAAALPRRPRHAHLGRGVHRRHRPDHAERQAAHLAASRPGRLRVPGLQPRADAHRGGEHHAAAGPRRAAARSGRGCDTLVDEPRHRRPAAPPALGAVGWPAAARRRRHGRW